MSIRNSFITRKNLVNFFFNKKISFLEFLDCFFIPFRYRRITSVNRYIEIRAQKVGKYKGDVFIISYPHSGRTWLAALLANIKEYGVGYQYKDRVLPDYLDEEVINDYSAWNRAPRIFMMHNSNEKLNLLNYTEKYIYILRDGRDVAISLHKALKLRKVNVGSIDSFLLNEFLQDGFNGSLSWSNHVKKYLTSNEREVFIVKYEDLHKNTFDVLRDICSFVGLECSSENIKKSIEICNFKSFQESSGGIGAKGGPGKWNEVFDNDTTDEFNKRTDFILKKIEYN
jgi:hypothetical protein